MVGGVVALTIYLFEEDSFAREQEALAKAKLEETLSKNSETGSGTKAGNEILEKLIEGTSSADVSTLTEVACFILATMSFHLMVKRQVNKPKQRRASL